MQPPVMTAISARFFRRVASRMLCAVLAVVAAGPLHAENLLDVFREAVQHDAVIRAAAAKRAAAGEARPKSRALLLPNFAFSADYSRNRNEIISADSPFFKPQEVFFWSRGYGLTLTQPIFNRDYFVQLKQADAVIKAADAEFAAAQQDLIIRVTEAYFNVLGAMDNLEFVLANKSSIQRQLEQAKQRFEVGLIAITDVHESQAAFDNARAQEIEALNLLSNTREALRVITGREYENMAKLIEEIPLIKPDPEDIDRWGETALAQNFLVLAAEQQLIRAREEVKRRRSGHLPTLNLSGSHRYSNVDDGFFGGSESEDSAIGLVFNLPIYQGGGVNALVREALHLEEQAREELELRRRETLRQTRDSYLNVLAGIETVKARRQSVISAQSALEATEAGLEVGTRTTVDVLNVRQNLLLNKRDYARSRYTYLLNALRLKQAAGSLTPQDLEQINAWLE